VQVLAVAERAVAEVAVEQLVSELIHYHNIR
jgi:hypothetical protein